MGGKTLFIISSPSLKTPPQRAAEESFFGWLRAPPKNREQTHSSTKQKHAQGKVEKSFRESPRYWPPPIGRFFSEPQRDFLFLYFD